MKILGSDYDGTLTRGGIGEKKLSAIGKWRESGNKFGIVSGRDSDFCNTLYQKFPLLELDFFAACNGGYIIDGVGKIIYEARCDEISAEELSKDLIDWKSKFVRIIQGDNCTCVVRRTEDRPSVISEKSTVLVDNIPKISYFNQISGYYDSVEDSAATVEQIRKKYGHKLNPLQNGKCIDIVPLGVNKAQALYRVMEFFGCEYDDVIAVGDNINDIDMIGEFRSYAMQNGVEAVKQLADGIVSDVTEIFEKER